MKTEKPEHALTRFRQSRGQTLETFAKDVGANKGMVWKWENGAAIPRTEYMRKLIEISEGVVTANDWYATAPDAPQEAAE